MAVLASPLLSLLFRLLGGIVSRAPRRERTCLQTAQKWLMPWFLPPGPCSLIRKQPVSQLLPIQNIVRGRQSLVPPRMPRAAALSKVLKKRPWLLVEFCQVSGPQVRSVCVYWWGVELRGCLCPAVWLMFLVTCEHTQLLAALEHTHMYAAEAKPSPPCLLCSPSLAL